MYGFMGYAAAPKSYSISRLGWIAALPMILFGINPAQATVQYRWVPTSIELNGVPLGPLQVYDVDFGVTDAAFQAGHASASMTCDSFGCRGVNDGLAAPRFFRDIIDVTLRPDGLVDGSYTAIRAAENFTLTGTGLLWSGWYSSDGPYRVASSNQSAQCGGLGIPGSGCTITGYFLAEALTTSAEGVPVPEPASAALVAVGLLALLRRRR